MAAKLSITVALIVAIGFLGHAAIILLLPILTYLILKVVGWMLCILIPIAILYGMNPKLGKTAMGIFTHLLRLTLLFLGSLIGYQEKKKKKRSGGEEDDE